jgi:hypothetical protein
LELSDVFLAFLFLNMATLTILYSILFFFLRAQTKGLLKSSVTDEQTADDVKMTTNTERVVRLGTSDEDLEASPDPSGPVTEAQPNPRTPRPNASARRTYHQVNKVSVTLLIYPVVYMILNMPISMARIAEFAGHDWGITFLHFGAALFECTGWINVLLYTSTRKGLVSWNRLTFWKRDNNVSKPSSGRRGRWTARDTPGDELVKFDSAHMTRLTSKTSESSITALKEEMSGGPGQDVLEDVESDVNGRL